jgi:hypothetical protein
VGPHPEKFGLSRLDKASRAFFRAPGHSSLLLGVPGAEVDYARDGSWRRCFMASALLGY